MMRGGTAHISSVEDLKVWFMAHKRPEWSLMHGFQDGVQQRGQIYRNQDEGITMEESWDLLEQMIRINTSQGARFTVFVPNNDAGNRGHVVKLQIGEAPSPFGSPYATGIAGYGAPGMISKAEVAELIEEKRQVWELQKRIEDLETRPALNGLGDVLKEKLLESDFTPVIAGIMEMFNTLVRSMTNKNRTQPLAVSVQGAPEDEAAHHGFVYDSDRIIPCLDRIRPHFSTDDEFYAFMDKISSKFAENPAMYKMMIG